MKPYHYTECGLDNVWLENGFTINGDELFIQDIHGLHRSIANHLLRLPRKLKGREIRFIRHYLDLSQKCLGDVLGSDYQSIMRWESNKNKITNSADKLLRVYLSEYLDVNSNAKELLDHLANLDNQRDEFTMEFRRKKNEWKDAA
jgi:DNA-binding transcriptional regulator YiaG